MIEQGHIVNFANSEKLNISFRNLTYYATSGKKDKILKNISGTFETGRLCAILGPSGAGKTTLLNILSGLTKPAPDSTFLINDKCISKKYIRRKCSYIPQDITFEKRFTVLETLKFAADLKQPDFVSNEEKQVIVNNVIESLGLQKCADTFVEKLSGGERKRLAMGEELLSNPGLMILDEPTSGLDSVTTVQIVTCLRKIAQSGRTVICVIHQPSSNILDLFDDFYVLSDGQCLYYGPVVDVIPAFEAAGYHCPNYYNKADFVVEVASHERKGNMDFLISNAKNQHIIQNIEPKSNLWPSTTTLSTISYSVQSLTVSVHSECGTVQSLPESDNTINLADKKEMNNFTYPISRWKQYGILVRRGFLCQRRNFLATKAKLIILTLMGCFVGGTYYDFGNEASKLQSNVSFFFAMMILAFLWTCLPIVLIYPSEAKIVKREYMNNWYALFPYFSARMTTEIPMLIASSIFGMMPAYILSSQPLEVNRILLYFVMILLTSLIALYFGFSIGILFKSEIGILIIPLINIPLAMYSGCFIPYKDIPTVFQPVTFITWYRYIFEGSIYAVYGNDRSNISCSGKFCLVTSVKTLLKILDLEENYYVYDVLGCFAWIVIFKIIAYCALRRKVHKLV